MSPSFCFSWHRLLRRTHVLWELYSAILKRNEKVLLAIRGSSVQECDATEALCLQYSKVKKIM